MADLNPEVFEDLQVAEKSRPVFEAAGLPLRTWEAYCLAFNERNLLRRELHRIEEGRGSKEIHPEVLERLQAIRTQFDPIVVQLRKFLPPDPAVAEDRERQEMVLGFITVSPTARDVAAKWIGDPDRFKAEAAQKLQLIGVVVDRYRRALRAEIDAQMTATPPPPPPPRMSTDTDVPVPGSVTKIMVKPPAAPSPPLPAPASLEAAATNGEISLIWSPVPGAAHYAVKRSAERGGAFSIIARPAQDCYSDTDLKNGTTYYYSVVAVDAAQAEGAPSIEIEATPIAPPLAPSSLEATPGNSCVSLAWSATPGASVYRLLRSTTPSGPFSAIASTPDLAFTDTAVSNGTTYYYTVAAQNSAGESPSSVQAQAMPVAPPPPPVGLAATPGNSRVSLSWTAVHGATAYTVRRADASTGPYEIIAGPAAPPCVDTSVLNGRTYYYAVSALNAGGESAPCATVAAAPLTPPAAPGGLLTSAGNGEIQLAWTPVPGAISYAVRRSAAATGPWTMIANPAGAAYTDTGLDNGVAVFYTIAAQNAGGESAASVPIAATPVAPPPVPTGLAASAGNSRITLTWHPAPGASTYVLRRSSAPGGPYETIAAPQSTSHTDLLLANDSTYYYTLAAKNEGGVSAPCEEVAATPVGPPGAPGELEAIPGNGKVSLRWRGVPNASRYRVMRSTTPSGPYTAVSNPTETEYLDAGITNGMTYYYVIRATNDGGKGPYSPEVKATPVAPPAAPSKLTAVPGNGSVALTWSEVAGATSYALYRAASADGPFAVIATSAAGSALDSSAANGTLYHYSVTARNTGGESARSAGVTAAPLAPPTAPTGLSATPGNGSVALSWNASPRASAYNVRRSLSPTGPFETIGSVPGTTLPDTTVTNGTLYHYTVSAVNGGGESGATVPVSAAPVAPPAPPSGLQLSAGNARVTLSWSAAPRATSYTIRRGTSAGGPYAEIASPAALSHVDTDVTNGTTFYYTVSALNIGGEGPASAEASATPVAAPSTVTGVEATAGNAQVSLQWPAVEGATGYVVKRALALEGPFTIIATPPTPAHIDTGLTNGTPYHYKISAVNAGGESAEAAAVSAAPIAPPQAPTGLSAAPGNKETTLTWTPSPRAQSYLVKRSATPGGPYGDVATAVGPTHLDTGRTNGVPSYYIVTAVNAGGESAPSAEVKGLPVDPPATPENVSATAGNNQVLVAWGAVAGATHYQVKRATVKRGPYVTTANVSRVSHLDNGVENGKTYFYIVHALNAGGRSAHSVPTSATPVPPPPAPTNLIALAGNSRVSLTWEAVGVATGYTVKRAGSPGGPFVTVARVSPPSYLDGDVANGTTYYYQVRSANGVVKGPLTATVQATPCAPPAAPAGLAAVPGHGTISLTWNPSAGAASYHVKRAVASGGAFETVASPEGPSWEDLGLANGSTYYYKVSAENAGGESADTSEIVASPVAPPAVPTGLQAVPASGEVGLSWNAISGATQYKVKRGLSPEGPFVAVAQPGEPGYSDTGLTNGTAYHYVVSALNMHGESLDSFPATATPVGVPASPTGLRAAPGNAKVDLAWNAVPYAVRYRVMRSGAPGGPYLLIASPRDPIYSDCPLTNGIPQYYVVSAVNAGGESAGCPELTSTPISSAPPEPVTPLPPTRAESPRTTETIATLESIPMPAGKKMQGIDLERLLDLRRVEQLRALFEGTAQKFEEWEVLTLIAEEGYETRKTMELVLRLKNQGNADAFTT
ncbi:MAG: hypothetical protein JOZ69_20550, partial [Myxococcales bacterium]|nr:hypothetical protein [Planctomycetaceae bacterium]MBV9949252.1 hypothetical protein [Myxococcales bacterium]